MDKKLRIGLIGCGNHMQNIIYNYLKQMNVQLIAICDINDERIKRFSDLYNFSAAYHDYRKMLAKERLDAVICVVNARIHYEVAKECMLRGINVFVEKTPCLNADQAWELLEIQKATGKYTMIGFNRRYATAYMMMKEIIERKEFGPVTMYLAKYNASKYSSEEYYIFNHVIHHLDLARYFLGEIKDIHTDRIALNDKKVGYNIAFTTEKGAIGVIQTGSLQHESYPMERVEITGDGVNVIGDNIRKVEYNRKGAKRDNFANLGLSRLEEGGDALCWNLNHGYFSGYSYLGYENELYNFISCILNGAKPEPSFEDTVKTMILLEKFRQSIKK